MFIFLQETHSCVDDEKFWRTQWGSPISFCHNSSSSGGVAILLTDGFQGKIIETLSSGIGRWIILVILLDNNFFIMVNIYGFNNSSNNKTLLDGISNSNIPLPLYYLVGISMRHQI